MLLLQLLARSLQNTITQMDDLLLSRILAAGISVVEESGAVTGTPPGAGAVAGKRGGNWKILQNSLPKPSTAASSYI